MATPQENNEFSALKWQRARFNQLTDELLGYSGPNRRDFVVPLGPYVRERSQRPYIESDDLYTGNGESVAEALASSVAPGISKQVCHSYADLLNSYLNKRLYVSKTEVIRHYSRNGEWVWSYRLKIVWPNCGANIKIHGVSEASSIKEAKEVVCRDVYHKLAPRIQMADEEHPSKESVQGDVSQSSEKSENTIVTRDQGITKSDPNQMPDEVVVALSSSEKAPVFTPLTKRWMLLDSVNVNTNASRSTVIKTYVLPEDCYEKVACAPNLMPFEAYVYARPVLRLKFVVNANKFHCGKIIAALRFDDYQADKTTRTINGALARPHVILDLTGNNQGELEVPFRFHRSFARTNATETSNVGVQSARTVSLDLMVLSQLLTGPQGSSDIDLRVFFTFEKTRFAGMSYRVPVVQMGDIIEDALDKIPTAGLKKLLAGAEAAVDSIGGSNKDKPVSHTESVVIPRARMNFCSGKGLSDSVPMRLNPTAQTSFHNGFLPGDEAQTTVELAQMWQLRSTFKWSNNHQVDLDVFEMNADPWCRSYETPYNGNPTLLELVSSMYAFASGTIDLRFDFVSNSFHTGTVLISSEFNRPSAGGAKTACESYSTYTKTFHLGEQKSVTYRVPYIYDTYWRRNTMGPFTYDYVTSTSADRDHAPGVRAEFSTKVKVRVVNVLRPVATAPQEIEVLVFWRAGPNFHLHGICQSGFLDITPKAVINFPFGITPTGTKQLRMSQKTKDIQAELDKLRANVASGSAEAVAEKTRQVSELQSQLSACTKQSESLNKEKATVQRLTAEKNRLNEQLKEAQKKTTEYAAAAHDKHQFEVQVRELTTKLETAERAKEEAEDRLHELAMDKSQQIAELTSREQRMRRMFHVPASFQMDSGDKEAEDETQNFAGGRVCRTIQSSDVQTNIKDILRQPVFLGTMTIDPISQDRYNWYLPIRPPARDWYPVGDSSTSPLAVTANWAFNLGLGRAPQCKLLSLFRFWRGSNRYTFIFKNMKNIYYPIYITHIPHSGCEMYGSFKATSSDGIVYPFQSGLRTSFVIPAINNTEVLEFPYDSENNWSLMWKDDPSSVFSFRDMGDYNAGHMVLYAEELIDFDLWWEAGDDFEVSNFYGSNNQTSNVWLGMYSDAHNSSSSTIKAATKPGGTAKSRSTRFARTQMADEEDFRYEDVLDSGSDVDPKMAKLAYRTAIGMIPYVGVPYNMAVALGDLDDATQSLKQVSSDTSDVMVLLRTLLTDAVKKMKPDEGVQYVDMILDFVVDVLIHLRTADYIGMGISFVRTLLRHLVGISVGNLLSVGKSLGRVFSMIFGTTTQAKDDGIGPALVGVLIAIVGTVVGEALYPQPFEVKRFLKGLIFRVTTSGGIGYIGGVLRVTSTLFELGKRVVYWAIGYKDPERLALQALEGQASVIGKFVTESQVLMSEANARMLTNPGYRRRYWINVMQAYQLQSLLAQVPPNRVSPVLYTLCAKVIQHANERFVDISSSPVRYEPFVICIEGLHNSGKSYMTEHLAVALLKAVQVNINESDPVYYRMPGSKFWSGYVNQPIVVYDDWMNLKDPELMSQSINELYQLKSTSQFIPDMAHLEDKRRRANPLVVILLTNNAYPTGTMEPVAVHTAAILRRRDFVLKVYSKKPIEQVKLESAVGEVTFDHLEFACNSSTMEPSEMSPRHGFKDTVEWMCKLFVSHHSRQQIEVNRRLKLFESLLPQEQQRFLGVEDPFTLFYRHSLRTELAAIAETPHEELAAEVELLSSEIAARASFVPEFIPPPRHLFEVTRTEGLSDIVSFGWGWFFKTMCQPSGLTILGRTATAKLQELIEFLMPDNEIVKAQCVDCGDWVSLYATCTRSYEKVMHVTCRECYRNALCEAPSPDTGEIRDKIFGAFVRHPDELDLPCNHRSCTGKLVVVADRMLYAGAVTSARQFTEKLITIDVFLDRMYVLTKNFEPFVKPFSQLTVANFLLKSWFGMCDPMDFVVKSVVDDWAAQKRGKSFFQNERIRGLVGEYVNFQAGEDTEGPPLKTAPLPQDPSPGCSSWGDIEGINWDNKKLHNLVRQHWYDYYSQAPRVPTACYHGELLDKRACVRFRKGAWHICDGTNMVVSENPCDQSCFILESWPKYRDFLETNYLLHKMQYQAALSKAINNQDSGSMADLMANVPHVYLPRALKISVHDRKRADDEIAALTEGSWYDGLTGSLGTAVKYFTVVAGVTAVAYAGYVGITKFFAPTPDPPSAGSQGTGTYNKSQSRHFNRQRALQEGRVAQVGTKLQVADEMSDPYVSVEKKVRRNMFRMFVYVGCTQKRIMGACGIRGHYAILPAHYFRFIDQLNKTTPGGVRVVLSSDMPNHFEQEYTFDPVDFDVCTDTDFAVFRLPSSWPMFVDIGKYIAKDEDLFNNLSGPAKIVVPSSVASGSVETVDITIEGTVNSEPVAEGEDLQEICGLMQYNFSRAGACGGIVMKKGSTRPIYAMHVAGRGMETTGIGFGIILSQEGLECFLKRAEPHENAVVQCSQDFEKAKIFFDEDVSVEYVGVTDTIPYQPSKTKIKPSLIQEFWPTEPQTRPCFLKRDEDYPHDKTPLVAGTEKHGRKSRDFPSSVVFRCVDVLWTKQLEWMAPAIPEPKRLTPEMACVGIPGVEYYEPLDLTTSSGYPWNRKASRGKVDYVTYIRDNMQQPVEAILEASLKREIAEKEAMRRSGIVPATIFLDTLKDERRPISKAMSLGGTRVFCMSPLDYSIALRQNFLHFYAAFLKNRWNSFHAVGIDANGEEWTILTYQLHSRNTKFVGIDYSNFGPAFNAVVANGAAELMVRWVMTHVVGVDEMELRVLMAETTQSLHLAMNLLYRQQCGSPSGAPDTTIKNTLVNMLYIMISWYYLWPEPDRTMMWQAFFADVAVKCYGDDCVMAVRDNRLQWFNGVEIQKFFGHYGITVSSADKLSTMAPFTTTSESSFLKRWWRKHELWNGQWHGALDKRSVEECCLWIWKSDNDRAATDENCRACLELGYAWGEDYFNDLRKRMNEARVRAGLEPFYVAWRDLDALFYPSMYK